MKRTLSRRIYDRLHREFFLALSRDPVSKVEIKKRQDLKEYGSSYGGWVVPVSLLDKDSVVYCVGCGDDITFDLALMERFGCEIHGFDPTPQAIEFVEKQTANVSGYHLHKFGIYTCEDTLRFYGPKNKEHVAHSLINLQDTDDYLDMPVKRLSTVMRELGHTSIDLLKIDIEGAEYQVIDSIVEDKLDIKIICVEYDEQHHNKDDRYLYRIRSSMNRLLGFGYDLAYAQWNANYTFVKAD